MIRKRIFTKSFVLLMITVLLSFALYGCFEEDNNKNKDIVYEDMKTTFDKSGMLSANIGIISRTEEDGSISYGEGGSGVVIKKDGKTYYALTAAHVVSKKNADLLVFTTNTDMKSKSIPGLEMNVLASEVYDTMYAAEVVYSSTRDDLAVIKFNTDEELAIISLSEEDPKIDDRIMCIGNPQNQWFALSYGKVLSGIQKFGEFKSFPSNGMKHSAYIQVGNSGGAAINEKMELVGIVTGASYSLDGSKFHYGVLIPTSEIKLCLNEWNGE